jgi:hypothetical protein
VVNVSIRFEHHHLVDFYSARFTYSAKVVSFQVDKHDVFGTLFRVSDEFL